MSTRKAQKPGPSLGSELLVTWRGGLSQERAAAALEVDHGAYCAFETGYRRPGPKRALRIEEKTGGKVPVASWDRKPSRSFIRSRAA